jgi:hypothetical protein
MPRGADFLGDLKVTKRFADHGVIFLQLRDGDIDSPGTSGSWVIAAP